MSLNQLLSFKGRASRSEFWIVAVTWMIVIVIVGVIIGANRTQGASQVFGGLLSVAVLIAYLWTIFAVQVRRWHDRNKSGWWALIAFVPLIGGIWVLVECGCLRGSDGPNEYGADPLSGAGATRLGGHSENAQSNP